MELMRYSNFELRLILDKAVSNNIMTCLDQVAESVWNFIANIGLKKVDPNL